MSKHRLSVVTRIQKVGLMLLIGFSGCNASPTDAPNDDRLLAFSADHRFGVVDEGAIVQFKVPLANRGQRPLHLLQHKVSCPCLSLEKYPPVIDPGKTEFLALRMTTERQQGRVSQKLFVRTDSPEAPDLILSVSGVVRGVWAHPASVDIGTMIGDDPVRSQISVYSAGFNQGVITSLTTSDPSLRTIQHPAEMRSKEQDRELKALGNVELVIDPQQIFPGRYHATLSVATNIPEFPKFNINVTGYRGGVVEATPSRIVFTKAVPGMSLTRDIKLSTRNATPGWSDRLELSSDHEFVMTEVIPRPDLPDHEAALRLRLQVPDVSTNELIEGDLVGRQSGTIVFALRYVAHITPASKE